MKAHTSQQDRAQTRAALATVLARLDNADAVNAFLEDLCTPGEIVALADRWSVVPLLAQGMPYRQIHEVTGVSVTTVGRIARCLEGGAGGYRAALQEHHRDQHQHSEALPSG